MRYHYLPLLLTASMFNWKHKLANPYINSFQKVLLLTAFFIYTIRLLRHLNITHSPFVRKCN
jgi:hypothetical protein